MWKAQGLYLDYCESDGEVKIGYKLPLSLSPLSLSSRSLHARQWHRRSVYRGGAKLGSITVGSNCQQLVGARLSVVAGHKEENRAEGALFPRDCDSTALT